MNLRKYVLEHSTMLPAADYSKPREKGDVYFFRVSVQPTMDRDVLRKLVALELPSVFDGEEHTYITLGAALDSQGVALQLMGAGEILGLWTVLEPRGLHMPPEVAQQMAGMGFVTITARKESK